MGSSPRQDAIALVGLGGRFPGGSSLDDLWRVVRDGVEVLEPVSDEDLDRARVDRAIRSDPRYVRQGTFLPGPELFDASFFGLSPREAQVLDPQQRIFLECAWEALEQAGYATGSPDLTVGVYGGAGMGTYMVAQLLGNPAFTAAVGGYQLMIGNDKDFLATRVSYKLNLRGPSMTVQTACSTSLVSVVVACRALTRGDCDLAIAGGVSILFPQRTGYLYEEGMIFSPDGHCRPFDAEAHGTRGGAGAAVVVLKRLADAIADRDTIHAVIIGAAINNDGSGKAGYTAPSIEGQVEVIATAQALAGVDPRSISYVEAHGTATPLGDPIEVAALTQVFRSTTTDTGFCRLGSLKANFGHLDAAAGAAGLIKTVLALKNRHLPPLVNFTRPNPQLGLERSPFVASATGADWPSNGQPRRAGVSSFGIGGTNAHVVLEEAPDAPVAPAARAGHLLLLSAKSTAALDSATANLAAHLTANPGCSLADVEWTLQVGRQAFPHRRAVVARDAAHAAALLGQVSRPPVLTDHVEGGTRPVAFLFSGQGSQHHAMGAGLYKSEQVYRDAIDRCATLLIRHVDSDIRGLLFAGEADPAIHQTRLTQPLLFAVEYALATLWQSWGITPGAMLGHSIGEYVAAHLAGVMSLEDALALVAARGRLMQALPPGNMAAVHLEPRALTRWLTNGVELAAVNAPGLCTIAGPSEAITSLVARLTESGVDARVLHTSHAFHSSMMEPALAPFTALLEKVKLSPPATPYVSNLTGTWITSEQATSPEYYARHLREVVRFEAGVRTIADDPAWLLLEVGPGNALTSLARLTVGAGANRRVIASLPHPREARPDLEATLEAAGRLWLAGATLDWRGFHGGTARRRVPLPTYPFERKPYWVEPTPAAVAAPATAAAAAVPRAGSRRPSNRIEEWFYAPTWTRDDKLTPGRRRLQGTWLVIGVPGPLTDAVAQRAESAGARAIACLPDAVETAAAVRSLDDLAGVVYLASHPAARPGGTTTTVETYYQLIAAAAAVSRVAPVLVIVATEGAASVLAESVQDPESALVNGPVLTLPTEIPGIVLRSVDVDADVDIAGRAEALVQEAAIADGEAFVAHRAGRRWVRRYEPAPLAPAAPAALPLKSGGVYLITGGTGGIGLTIARWLATQASARLVLTSRRTQPDPEILREIEQAGGEALVMTADVVDEASMRQVVDAAHARWGGIDGVIHAAGIPGVDKPAAQKPREDAAAVLTAKIDGLHTLIHLLGDTPLDLVVLLSSTSAIVGATGLCDYASANAVLDAFAESDYPRAWQRVVSINYAAWRDAGMWSRWEPLEEHRQAHELLRQSAIPTASGIDAFARILASGRTRIVVTPTDLNYLIAVMRELVVPTPGGATTQAPIEMPALGADTPAPDAADAAEQESDAPWSDTERRLRAIWKELLGVDRIGIHDDFFELGGHSLLATRVLARIDTSLGARLTLRDVFDSPTIKSLSVKIDAARAAASPNAADPAEDREEIEF